MPKRGHSAQTRAGVLLHEQVLSPESEKLGKSSRTPPCISAILLWHSACHSFSCPVEVRPNGAIFRELELAGNLASGKVCQAIAAMVYQKRKGQWFLQIELSLTQEEIAEVIGTTRETVTRLFANSRKSTCYWRKV